MRLKKKEVKSINAASKVYDIPYTTLSRRVNGGLSNAESHESSQLLSHAEENMLQLWCSRLTAGGRPIPHQVICELVWEILMHRNMSVNTDEMQLITSVPIGQDWVKRFVQRHSYLKIIHAAKMDLSH